ncbi:unnamed protein product [Urochloa decumbens]|uniref:Uncharacterized protein n=1 Tax=Urochloa decumbens TaxID=240449 RepID=A0ABC9BR61_9POAL
MPPIAHGQDDLNRLNKHVIQSVVSVNTYDNVKYGINFTTGFIIFSERSRSLICVHKSVIKKKKGLFVHFSDGTIEKAAVFLEETSTGHTILVTESKRGHARTAVSFCERVVEREELFIITEVEGGYNGFNFMTGTVNTPSCKAIDRALKEIVPGSESKFALSCPAREQILGAGVFNLEGLLIGTVSSFDEDAFNLKFAQQTCHWVDELEAKLKAKDAKISLSKKGRKTKPGPRVTKKRRVEDRNDIKMLREEGPLVNLSQAT